MINSQKNTGRNIKNKMLELTGVKGEIEDTDKNIKKKKRKKNQNGTDTN